MVFNLHSNFTILDNTDAGMHLLCLRRSRGLCLPPLEEEEILPQEEEGPQRVRGDEEIPPNEERRLPRSSGRCVPGCVPDHVPHLQSPLLAAVSTDRGVK
mgnify:CR=1 FL=1